MAFILCLKLMSILGGQLAMYVLIAFITEKLGSFSDKGFFCILIIHQAISESSDHITIRSIKHIRVICFFSSCYDGRSFYFIEIPFHVL